MYLYTGRAMQTAVTCYDDGMTEVLPHFQNGAQMH